MKSKESIIKYYIYAFALQMRLTRIVNILYITKYLGISIMEFALLQSVFSITQFVMEIPSGFLSDYFSKKRITILGLFLTIVSQLIICNQYVTIIDNQLWILIIAFMIEGIGRAFMSGADDALFYESIRNEGNEELYVRIRGKLQLVSSISVGVATLVGTLLYSLETVMPYYGQCIMTLVAVGTVMTVKEKNISKPKKKEHLSSYFKKIESVKNEPHIIFMICLVCLMFGLIDTIFGLMPNYMSNIGFSDNESGLVFMLLSFIGGIIATQSYRIENSRYEKIIKIISVCLGGGALIVALFSTKAVVYVGLVMLYIIIDILDPIAMKVFNIFIDDSVRATFLSIVAFLISATTMILYPIVGCGIQFFGMKRLLVLISIIIIPLLYLSTKVYNKVVSK